MTNRERLSAAVTSRFWIAALIVAASGAAGCGDLRDRMYLPHQLEPCGDACDDYRLQAQPPPELRVMTYNVFLRPAPISAWDQNDCRAQKIGQWLTETDLDIVALQETFDPAAASALAGHARHALPFQVVNQPPPNRRFGTSGGLTVLSRYPIEEVRTLTFDECRGKFSDCMAAKGAVHAVVRVSEHSRVNVVVTHLNAGRADANREARAAQVDQLRSFIADIDPDDGPTLALGDFNIDALANDGEYEELTAVLDVGADPPVQHPSTINCKSSLLCDAPPLPRRLDFVFTGSTEHRLFNRETSHLPMADEGCGDARYLSDHRAVWSTYDTSL